MFILIWTRWGFLVPIYALIATALVVEVGPTLVANADATNKKLIALAFGAVVVGIGAAATWFTGRALNNPAKDIPLQDPQTGEAVIQKDRSTFFFLNMEWWAVAFPVIAIFSYLR